MGDKRTDLSKTVTPRGIHNVPEGAGTAPLQSNKYNLAIETLRFDFGGFSSNDNVLHKIQKL
jgi:hypothetical protein